MCKYLSEVGYHEARGEPDKGEGCNVCCSTTCGIEKRWANTVKGVLRQPIIICLCMGWSWTRRLEKQRYKEIVLIAHKVVNGAITKPCSESKPKPCTNEH